LEVISILQQLNHALANGVLAGEGLCGTQIFWASLPQDEACDGRRNRGLRCIFDANLLRQLRKVTRSAAVGIAKLRAQKFGGPSQTRKILGLGASLRPAPLLRAFVNLCALRPLASPCHCFRFRAEVGNV
jgi:hypothetical protein